MNAYGKLAECYDRLMEHVDFSAATRFYLRMAEKMGWKGQTVLDLACGTGSIMLELLKRGYDATGVDVSQDMLAVADNKIFTAGFTPKLICQNLKDLVLTKQYNLVLCTFDSLNYVLKEKDLARIFKAVYKALTPEGLFLFDVHSEYKMGKVMGNNTFTYAGEDIFYIWRNSYNESKKTQAMKLDIMLREKDNLYRRIEEFHEQRYYPPKTIRELLESASFQVGKEYGDWKFRNPAHQTERIFYVAVKKDSS